MASALSFTRGAPSSTTPSTGSSSQWNAVPARPRRLPDGRHRSGARGCPGSSTAAWPRTSPATASRAGCTTCWRRCAGPASPTSSPPATSSARPWSPPAPSPIASTASSSGASSSGRAPTIAARSSSASPAGPRSRRRGRGRPTWPPSARSWPPSHLRQQQQLAKQLRTLLLTLGDQAEVNDAFTG